MSEHVQLAQTLAFLYLTFGHATDGVLTAEEMTTLGDRVRARVPALSSDEVARVLRQIIDLYGTLGSVEQRLSTARAQALQVRQYVDLETRRAIMGDLVEIAKADGYVSDEELALIDELSATFGAERVR